ncbi:MAG TPA: PEP-CTERM sorting domain-containing protein [Casimicrobiaceae bacterium]|nr:PEP-CTERM sorting domain-containing protein [Casimicrobiaceae bacterium]
MKRLLSLVGAFGFALSLAAGPASANIVYNFSGVSFTDGGTLTGSFTTNDLMNTLVDFDITTSTNGTFGFHYTPGGGSTSFSSLPTILVLDAPGLADILQVTFSSLTTAGGVIFIGQFDSFEQGTSGTHREIVGGEVVAATPVPEPAPLALLAIGLLAMLGYAKVRRGS